MALAEEHQCALDYAKTNDPLLAARLVMANMRLVISIARDLCRSPSDLSDLVQEGSHGLIRALGKYDPNRGVRLSNYAALWIRSYILRFTINNWRLVRVGTTQAQRDLFFNLRKERHKLERTGAVASTRQLASILQVKETEVVAMMERFAGNEASLDAPSHSASHDTRSVADLLSALSASRPDLQVADAEFIHVLRAKLKLFGDGLQGREAKLFSQRLVCEHPRTLSRLAVEFGVTRERARQVEHRLKLRLRSYLEEEMGDALDLGRTPKDIRAGYVVRLPRMLTPKTGGPRIGSHPQ